MPQLNRNEINALRYYTGDTSCCPDYPDNAKAYVVLNSLFFSGIATESARAAEGKFLDSALITDIPMLCDLLGNIFSAFSHAVSPADMQTFRVERYSDYQKILEAGRTVSFTSTSTAGFLDAYRDRKGIALMRFSLPAGTHCIDMASLLDEYRKSGEQEILLPPLMKLGISQIPLTESEKNITDSSGEPPAVSCSAVCSGYSPMRMADDISADGASAGERVFAALNSGKTPEDEDIRLYTEWKKSLFIC